MKIHIETLGCPKNFNDTRKVQKLLEEADHVIADNPEKAEGIMINTCGFIEDAKIESIDRIFEMASLKPDILIVSGCLSQRYSRQLLQEMPEVDIFLGVNNYNEINHILENHKKGLRKSYVNGKPKDICTLEQSISPQEFSATVKISEGCDNACAYCIIPSIRGRYRSRPMDEIEKEVRLLVKKGIKEIILIGQDVTAYGMDIYGDFLLHELVDRLCNIEELIWLRLMYCYEDRITDKFIETIAKQEKVCKYIDIPIQHSSPSILKAMRRRGGRDSMEHTIKSLREAIKDIVIRTTLIVGFPGETEEDFQNLLDFVEKTEFDRLGVFTYSAEEGTYAASMDNQIDEKTKKNRQETIMRRQMEISLKKNKKLIGKEIEAVVEEKDGQDYLGRSRQDAPEIDNGMVFKSSVLLKPGDIVKVKITDAFDYDLTGEMSEILY